MGIFGIFGFSRGAQTKAKERSNTNNQVGEGGTWKSPCGTSWSDIMSSGMWGIGGENRCPRVTEALGSGWPLARDRVGDNGC